MKMNQADEKKSLRIRKRKRQIRVRLLLFLFVCSILVLTFIVVKKIKQNKGNISGKITKNIEERPELDVQLLTPNEYSRPGIALDKVKGIVIHYTANPGTTAQNNRDYFEGLKDSHVVKASSHFVIGLEGEIIQCIPSTEISYASNQRNSDTISIEVCHPDESGKFNEQTYQSLVQLTSWLCTNFDLKIEDVIRHYDVTGKNCPKYFVEHEDAWEKFKGDILKYIEKHGTPL